MNPRSAQLLTAGLGLLLAVVVGAAIFFLLSRPANQVGPTPTPTPSGIAVASPTFTVTPLLTPSPSASASPGSTTPSETPTPSPTLSPSLSPSASASVVPTESPSASPTISPSPTATLEPTASPTPTLVPTPTATISPTAPQREFRLLGVGIDSLVLGEARIERVASFNVDGQSLITARVTNASAAGIRLCVWREADFEEGDCVRGRNVSISQVVLEGGSSTWHASLLGTSTNVSPSADLTVTYNGNAGRVELRNFRFVGTFDTAYNGFLAEVPVAGDGDLRLQADFEEGSESYRLVMERAGDATLVDESGSGPSIDRSTPITGGSTYRVSFRSTEEVSGAGFVHADLTWP